jgi:general secretion pathway protein L
MEINTLKTRLGFTAPLRHRLAGAWKWWLTELGDMLPERIRSLVAPGSQYLCLELDNAEVIASQHTLDESIELARYPLDGTDVAPDQRQMVRGLTGRASEVVLCLPRNKVLIKTLTLPLAAAENLREVLGFEMDRQTPFRIEQVYYDYVVASADPKARRLDVVMVLTPRVFLDELLDKLRAMKLAPHRASVCGNGDLTPYAVNLLPESQRQRKSAATRILNLTLTVLTGVLLLGAVALPLLDKHFAIRNLESRIDVASGQAEVARRLRTEVDRLNTGVRFLVEKKQSTPLALEVISELTRILPDDTWITRLDLKDHEVHIQGQSLAAAALIPLIESSPMLANARFRSPVTKIPRTDKERFHLSAEFSSGVPK